MTRIIAGRLGGRRLRVPGEGTRPTSDRVRESVFNILAARSDLDGLWVLDLYAGSGALGLEAISRGAAGATFVDSGRRAAVTIAANVRACGVGPHATVHTRTVSAYLGGAAERRFGLVFSDPPYDLRADRITADLELLRSHLDDDALIVVERSTRSTGEIWPSEYEVVVDKSYGDTRVEIARLV
ncbi:MULTISPECIES: 16S rRNA (guanine(966)-N(2))-methyltransferase RsmD [Gordonia]|uniref:16S rRNA (guanine(966)-N(2))-methyltransferase RsmD n=1 Tax=Gordonia TaxID=2053 RepID=UPI00080E67EB|nr:MULTISPECIES: 16S rRNA (guanine(966)-N(2))-methyltransferase RsmD [Gordonia]OCH83388.1 16S rRNA (guanine(966)-N(2))-methyltransferase RsmD [Gordonia sp. UCD-TK1]UPG70090.1 16S rRNA (guanine(966)-N(2))-methyltransferase RsmD [Gordonia hongkongensis]